MVRKSKSLLSIPFITSLGFKLLITGIIAILIVLSMLLNLSQVNRHMIERALHEARGVFSLMLLAREWNSFHSGVYVEVTDLVKPNPYLKDPNRDLVVNGKQYTKMNPAFMTREIADLTKQKKGTVVHITSLTPLNPANKADEWERAALQQFNQGSKEYYQFITSPQELNFRYAAPLKLEESCLHCHDEPGNKPGQVRGAISVTLPGKPLVMMLEPQKKNIIISHGIVFGAIAGLIWLFLSSLRRNWQEIHKMEEELMISQKSLKAVFDSIHDAVFIHDKNGRVIDANETMLRMFGIQRSQLQEYPLIEDYFCDVDGINNLTDRPMVLGREPELLEFKACSPENGKEFYAEVFLRPLIWNKLESTLVMVRDITQRKEYEKQMEYQAYHDSLTGLPNRLRFVEILNVFTKQEKSNSAKMSVMFLDLDGFKDVNDTFGHQVGDELLQETAARLTGALGEGDVAARLGGDEFMVMVRSVMELQDVTTVADRILTIIRQPFILQGHTIFVTTSIGICFYPSDGEDSIILLQKADKALYRSKELGRNRWTLFSEEGE